MMTQAKPEHAWLKQLVGEWTMEAPITMENGETAVHKGTETVTMLGDLWAVCEGTSDMPGGGTGRMRMTIGFDPARGGYCGTWVGSMMDTLWLYQGTLNDAGTELVLAAEGPDFQNPGKTMTYNDVITIIDANTRTLTSRYRGQDGSWTVMMVATYTRTA